MKILTPATEVTRLVGSALSGCESGLDVSVITHWVFTCEQFRCDLGIALVHQVLIDKSSVMSCVAWNVLLSDHVGGATDPVNRILASVSVDVWVNGLGGWKVGELLIMPGQLESVKLLGNSTTKTDLSIDLT